MSLASLQVKWRQEKENSRMYPFCVVFIQEKVNGGICWNIYEKFDSKNYESNNIILIIRMNSSITFCIQYFVFLPSPNVISIYLCGCNRSNARGILPSTASKS